MAHRPISPDGKNSAARVAPAQYGHSRDRMRRGDRSTHSGYPDVGEEDAEEQRSH